MKIKYYFSLLLLIGFSAAAQDLNDYFKPVKYRSIGPFRGGRSNSVSGVVGDPLTYYMGTTGGGLWKTTDAGQHWYNISDGFFKTGSVGAVAVSESDPNVIYVGMGEHAIRGVMTSYGDGVYKSTDAGKTWKHIGLTKTQQIARIVIDPKNPDVVYVAAQGAMQGPTAERGVYKSTNGGESWEQILFVNEQTGANELSMDIHNPNVLYASMWEHQRTPWKMISGGAGSGLYKSTDAGKTWDTIHNGLPEEKGKMAIAVSRANPDKVYALIESDSQQDKGGLFVSNNAGKSWNMVSGDNRLTQRAWYYTEVFADPSAENTVYVLSAPALRSTDGGKTWERLSGTHGDYHDLWINPANSKNMVIGNDGGAAISYNYGESWSTQDNMPTAQFYRINTDNLYPYNIYAGQQDNSSVKIASMAPGSGSIGRENWSASAGGESAFLAFDPDDPRYVYGGSYLGTIEVLDTETKMSTNIMAAPIQYLGKAARDMKYLYNWNAPIIWSQHEPGTVYHAAQLVLKTSDMGKTWTEFSPDLTRNIDAKQGKGGGPYTVEAVGAENYGTISYLIESPHEAGVFYTGSDDGLVHLTRDNGKSWQNITPKGLDETLINAIEVSPHDPATAYIATTRYKFNDYTPALYKTTDYGKSWSNISSGIPYGAYTRVVREDADRKGLLYAGTEQGVYVSFDAGKTWKSLQLNLPVTPVTDLKVHRGDLIVATSGRSFWILDDLKLLANYENKTADFKLYEPEASVYGSWYSALNGSNPDFDGTADDAGVNPANGVVLYYNLPRVNDTTELQLSIRDAQSKLITRFSSEADENFKSYAGGPSPAPTLSKQKGLNRFVWDGRHSTLPGVEEVYIEAGYSGHKVAPGTYSITLDYGDQSETVAAVIQPNPNLDIPAAQFAEYDRVMTEMEAKVTEMHELVNTLKSAQDQLSALLKTRKNLPQEVQETGKKLVADLQEWDEKMVQRKSKAYDDVENFENKFTANYMFLLNQTESSIPRVNASNLEELKLLNAEWQELKADGNTLLKTRIPEYNASLWQAGIGAIQVK
ncbi:WD40/YVTN/BNR-like repeat-containing protein [Leeuwenhoekiella nanhaiensis]|uniref:Glycosyl hydrolase n=1 Tax=Leeuwenhoekiella nanhaiensis TaxID=1655491 RepID=A0A2G1VUN1_9FLAO|nr:exo-alpha-sialidase [Leeuwenhoekiella nanhaiensis]PHQ30159.1 glycosyl hydrolase [Leeuwenhoekiella nanhaiensis]